MKTISEKELKELDKKGKVLTEAGKKLKFEPTPEERQAQALEKIVTEIDLASQANNKNAVILRELVSKIKTPDINVPEVKIPEMPKMPNLPEPVRNWDFTIERTEDGKIKTIHAKGV